jgi:hypothetical protein
MRNSIGTASSTGRTVHPAVLGAPRRQGGERQRHVRAERGAYRDDERAVDGALGFGGVEIDLHAADVRQRHRVRDRRGHGGDGRRAQGCGARLAALDAGHGHERRGGRDAQGVPARHHAHPIIPDDQCLSEKGDAHVGVEISEVGGPFPGPEHQVG